MKHYLVLVFIKSVSGGSNLVKSVVFGNEQIVNTDIPIIQI